MFFKSRDERRRKAIESGKYLAGLAEQLSRAAAGASDDKTSDAVALAKEAIAMGDPRPLVLLIQAATSGVILRSELEPYFRSLGATFFACHAPLVRQDPGMHIAPWLAFYVAAERVDRLCQHLRRARVDVYGAAEILESLLLYDARAQAKEWIRLLQTFEIAHPQSGQKLFYRDVREAIRLTGPEAAAILRLENELDGSRNDKLAKDVLDALLTDGMNGPTAEAYVAFLRETGALCSPGSSRTPIVVGYLRWTGERQAQDWREYNAALTKNSDIEVSDAVDILLAIPPQHMESESISRTLDHCAYCRNENHGFECLDTLIRGLKGAGFTCKFSDEGSICAACNGSGVAGANYDSWLESDNDPGYACASCDGDGGKRTLTISARHPDGPQVNWSQSTTYRSSIPNSRLKRIFN